MIGRYVPPEPSSTGSGLKQLFIPFFNDDGHLEIKESGIFDRQDQIDANAAACDISVLISRYEAGDLTVLNRRQGLFGDFTSAPDSYRQALEIIHSYNAAFNGLTPDQRCGASNAFDFLDKINSYDPCSGSGSDPGSGSGSDPGSDSGSEGEV